MISVRCATGLDESSDEFEIHLLDNRFSSSSAFTRWNKNGRKIFVSSFHEFLGCFSRIIRIGVVFVQEAIEGGITGEDLGAGKNEEGKQFL